MHLLYIKKDGCGISSNECSAPVLFEEYRLVDSGLQIALFKVIEIAGNQVFLSGASSMAFFMSSAAPALSPISR